MLMCGINALDAQFCDYIFILYYSHLKLSLLLHKTILVTFLLGSTVTEGLKNQGLLKKDYNKKNLGKKL